MKRSRLTFAYALTLAATSSACSVLLDWSSYTGGAGDGGAGEEDGSSDATTDVTSDDSEAAPPADVVVACGNGGVCAPSAASPWMGPVSLHVGGGAPPPCDGNASSLFDGKGDLVAPAASCTSCGCGGATGVGCNDPVMTAFEAPDCSSGGTTQSVSSSSCGGPIFATAVTVAAPQPTGSCTPSGGVATAASPTWGSQARACPVTPSGTCSGGSLCVPAPPASSAVCVMAQGAVTACPAGYPSGPQIFYTGIDDARGCTPCTCAVSGVTCTIATPAIGAFDSPACSGTPAVPLSAPSACTPLGTSLFVEQLATPSLSGTGTCSTSGGGMATGMATGTGATSFCCLP